jgi:LPS export ABC transporter protein LptC
MFKDKRVRLFQINVCSSPEKRVCISSDEGLYDPERGSFLFRGHVVLRAPGQGVLHTPELAYLPRKEVLATEKQVRIYKQGLTIKGRGFVYDFRSRVMKVLHQTEVQVDG